jgi:preprotein translocase subunit SecG
MRKGDLSINIIIVAALALIILVIISVLLFRSGSQIGTGTSCTGLGGTCIDSGGSCSDLSQNGETWILHPTAPCTSGMKCCVKQ